VKILQVHNRYRSSSPGGEDRVVDQEGRALAAQGHVVERFERANDDIDTWSRARQAVVPAQVVWSPSAREELRGAIERFGPDVVHVHNTFPLLSAAVLFACRDTDTPAVVTLHNYRLACATGDLFRDGHICHECLGKRVPTPAIQHGCYRSPLASVPIVAASAVFRHAWRTLPAAYVLLSRSQRDLLAPLKLPSDRVFVKDNLVHELAPARAAGARSFVVYAGRLAPAKGLRVLMRAWDDYAETPGARLRLVIAGSGPLDDEVAQWASARRSVELLGLLSREACARLMRESRAVIVPSEWEETFGLSAIEAMACGVPPVGAAHGSLPELIRDGHDGVLFPPADAPALARVLRDIDEDPHRFAELGRAARRTYEQRFDPVESVEQLTRIYEFAITHPPRR
jgi:glycosyltransferase involved in cell wall biosynthesis